jgi:hypothetical protein
MFRVVMDLSPSVRSARGESRVSLRNQRQNAQVSLAVRRLELTTGGTLTGPFGRSQRGGFTIPSTAT